MWNLLSILLVVSVIYGIVKEVRERRILTDFLNNKENVLKVNKIIQDQSDDKDAVDKIKDDFDLNNAVATDVFAFVQKIN
ncbi:hypothetical protein [Apilactobacillus timberlakei]|uniref:Uncharacterized protein n=1 Tax=Apilactobacillus timberlakei TaxID=2008380 RepID=A0ABY2YTE1_9LACO|nr:hypothetical protein [Apilactobacillus timberlakei]TPR14250.1 hypothetical protein DY048_04705 [Apilactobacillus timberlakei]TPR16503.1 hypothetical protein DY052_02795 [Apilactobacillus timberlakei]TPR19550.1 hypothetical protein DY138_02595 [Apilactobacillus timberlakei]TPR20527.1 hypothetical protein DY061_04235 [Apilactobacillus timberlakei]TPR22571.1 hypothetical protein DY083_03505 [Apilactobacillus timberlakei]